MYGDKLRHFKRYVTSPNLYCDAQGMIFLVSLDA